MKISKYKKLNNSEVVVSKKKKNGIVTQLVTTDGMIELLVHVLEEQLYILAQPYVSSSKQQNFASLLQGSKSPKKEASRDQLLFYNTIATTTTPNNIHNYYNHNTNPTKRQYSQSVSESIWLILMNIGTCGEAINLLKTKHHQQSSHHQSSLRKLVMGIIMSLNFRFYVSGLYSNNTTTTNGNGNGGSNYHRTLLPRHIMSDKIYDDNIDDEDDDEEVGSWMEDLFVTLCRLVGSKHANNDNNNNNNNTNRGREGKENNGSNDNDNRGANNSQGTTKGWMNNNNAIRCSANDHDDIRSLLIEKFVVKKCLQLLVDERNTVTSNDPFVTTLAMSFFYACVQFTDRYKKLHNSGSSWDRHRRNNNNGANRYDHHYTNIDKTISRSLDYDRLIHFTMTSMQSFPSHQLIQGTGCLILESIPKPYKLLWMNKNGNKSNNRDAANNYIHRRKRNGDIDSTIHQVTFVPHRKSVASSCIQEVVEPCSWYCAVPE